MDDNALIELFWERSPEAVELTQQKYGALCRSLAGRLLRCAEDVEECLNDTLVSLWDAIPPARPVHLAAYISRITRNLAMKRLSYLSADKRAGEAMVSFDELEECVSTDADPAKILEGRELEAAVAAFLEAQDRESRVYFLRRYWFFDSVKEIAARYGVSESKVKVRLFRTRSRLKEYLVKEGYVYER